jgi:hypothetical protein
MLAVKGRETDLEEVGIASLMRLYTEFLLLLHENRLDLSIKVFLVGGVRTAPDLHSGKPRDPELSGPDVFHILLGTTTAFDCHHEVVIEKHGVIEI